jgi:membrane-bound lytic murein transglycosylase D
MTSKRAPASLAATLLATALALSACAPGRPAPAAPAPVPAAHPEPEALGTAPEVVEEKVAAAERDILGSMAYDLPLESNSRVAAELDFLVGQRREVIGRWLARGDRYEDFIKEILRSHGLPTDLFHLAMIESGFVPTARSRAGAVGLWQFMPGTGRDMGLRVDSLVDERMDPVRSTRAAARHLRWLHRTLNGDWALAAAAYNAGSGRITRGLQSFGATSFWDLAQRGDLAQETRHYVPRLFAVTVIARDRQRFGFAVPRARDGFAFDSIQVEYAVPLDELARIAQVKPEVLRELNPHLVRQAAPAGGYWVWVPAGKGMAIQRGWLASDFRKEQGYGSYAVRPGDQLGRLAELAGVRSARIRELNPDVDFDRLPIGTQLRLPFRAAQQLSARPSPPARTASREGGEGRSGGEVHVVQSGESLWEIARRHGVEVAALQSANGLRDATIRSGQELRVPTAEGKQGKVAARAETTEHVVGSGESLWGIARRYGTTVEALQAANDLGERPIQPGQKLVVPGKG